MRPPIIPPPPPERRRERAHGRPFCAHDCPSVTISVQPELARRLCMIHNNSFFHNNSMIHNNCALTTTTSFPRLPWASALRARLPLGHHLRPTRVNVAPVRESDICAFIHHNYFFVGSIVLVCCACAVIS